MKHMIDPREAAAYSSYAVNWTASTAAGELVRKRDANRVAFVLTYKDSGALAVNEGAMVGVRVNGTFVALATVSENDRVVVLRLEDYGPVLQDDLYIAAENNDVSASFCDVFLSSRGSE